MITPYNHIQYLHRSQIDDTRWDACISNAPNGLVYAYTTYLDHLAPGWHALVLNDYEAVMPLIWNKKYGIHYLYQPMFCASLGVFGEVIDAVMLTTFLRAIPKKFKYWDIALNRANVFEQTGFPLYLRRNYILSLQEDYDTLAGKFRNNILRNVRKCMQQECRIEKEIPFNNLAPLIQEQLDRFTNVKPEYLQAFGKLYKALHQQKRATTYAVYTKQGQLLSTAIFFYSNNRAYYILPANHPNGKTLGTSHALINAFIKDHANTNLVLDFEGSDVHNIAFFYSSFGAAEERYAAIRLNRLPWVLKWLK